MKQIIYLIFVTVFLTNCAYQPIVDTAGRSGTFDISKATEITNDLQHCKTLADNNTSFLGNIVFWIESPTADTKHEHLYRQCLKNRGHSILN